jgi:transcriptional regulator with XRE-family HTH domain
MNFSEFLRQWRAQKNLATAKEHYEELGGEKSLGITLRHFQQIESGKHAPSEALLAALFSKTPASARKALVMAFFKTAFAENAGAASLITYLEQHLSPAIETESKSLWESTRRLMMYSEEQLDYLEKNPDAFRLHRRVMLLEKISKFECNLSRDKLKMLESLDLIVIAPDGIKPSRTLYRIPHYDNSSPRAVGKATDYILKHLDHYSAREGSPGQELSYAMQMVSPAVADRVLEQMKAFKRWVQSLASTDVGPEVSPLLFVGFVRSLDRREL